MKTENKPDLSVIVCFKDWGLERLAGVTRSIKESGLGRRLEIVIADYGSLDSDGYRETLESLGARYFYFETDGVWSRSRALNLGIREATGKYIVTTDSDMVFTPETFPYVLGALEQEVNGYFILQCRDLPEGITHETIESGAISWKELEAKSRLRPRWGMGGLIAFPRWAYEEVRGLDERLHTYGGEDIDLAKRLTRVGLRRIWIDEPDVRMFHVWHSSSLDTAQETEAGKSAVRKNREIHLKDKSTVRNLEQWLGRPPGADPLVTVAISTFNRASYLEESLQSVFAQTFRDFEVIVVNDGSTDETSEILERVKDPRLRVFHQENRGLAAARNFITREAKGKYIAVHDDDDIMLPDRLERQLAVVGAGVNGSYGGWVDFDNETGDRVYNPGKRFSLESLSFNNSVYLHPTLLIERRMLELVPYDVSMRSGSDYNLAVRLARAGAKLIHCGNYVLLRRGHAQQITNVAGQFQRVSGRLSGGLARSTFSQVEKAEAKRERSKKDWVEVPKPAEIADAIAPYLPDHLESRSVRFAVPSKLAGDFVNSGVSTECRHSGTVIDRADVVRYYRADRIPLATLLELHKLLGNSIKVVRDTDEEDFVGLKHLEFESFVQDELLRLNPGFYRILQLERGAVPMEELNEGAKLIQLGNAEGGNSYLVIPIADSSRVSGWGNFEEPYTAEWLFERTESA